MANIEIVRPELVWPVKYDDEGSRLQNRGTSLPFQVVETIKEGRATREPGRMSDLWVRVAEGDAGQIVQFLNKMASKVRRGRRCFVEFLSPRQVQVAPDQLD